MREGQGGQHGVVSACRLDLLRVTNHCLHLLALLGQAVIG